MKRRITFREVKEKEHLEECFALRHRHFDNARYKIFLNGNVGKIDLDKFDFYCKHWAVFNEEQQIVGYARIFQGSVNDEIVRPLRALVREHSIPLSCPAKESCCFPLFTYQESHSMQTVESFFENLQNPNVVELSRFVIENGHSFRVSKFMVEAGLGIYHYLFDIQTVILACRTGHEKFWNHYGFKRLKCNETYDVGVLNSVNLFSDFKCIKGERLGALEQFAKQYQLKKEISIEI